MDAELSGFIGTSGYNTAFVRITGNYDRLPPVFGMIQLFNGREKRVEVNMKKNIRYRHYPSRAAAEFSPWGRGNTTVCTTSRR